MADAPVPSDGFQNCARIGIGKLRTNCAELIGKTNFHGHCTIQGNLRELRTGERHAFYRLRIGREPRVKVT